MTKYQNCECKTLLLLFHIRTFSNTFTHKLPHLHKCALSLTVSNGTTLHTPAHSNTHFCTQVHTIAHTHSHTCTLTVSSDTNLHTNLSKPIIRLPSSGFITFYQIFLHLKKHPTFLLTLHNRYLLRFFDCLAHPNISAAFATDQKWPICHLRLLYQSLAGHSCRRGTYNSKKICKIFWSQNVR